MRDLKNLETILEGGSSYERNNLRKVREMGKNGKKGMIALMMLMVTAMAALFVHIMWINRPVKAPVGAEVASVATAERP